MRVIKHIHTALFLIWLSGFTNAGINTWTQCSGTDGYFIDSLLIDTTTTGRIYAGTNGFLISNDYGTTWIFSNYTSIVPGNGASPFSIAVNPKSPNEVYLYLASGLGIAKSTTYGNGNWISVNNTLPTAAVPNLLIDPENVGRMYVGSNWNAAFIYLSDDTGYNWVASMSGITTDQGVDFLMMHPAHHNWLYAGTGGSPGIYISMNGATTWNSLPLYMTVRCMAIDPTNDQYIYAGSAVSGFARSIYGGLSWEICTDTTISNYQVRTVVVNPINPKIIYISTDGNGMFKSKDRGNTWYSIQTGLTSHRIWCLAYDTITRTLFAGTEGLPSELHPNGIWMYQDTDLYTPPDPVDVPKDVWQLFN